MSDIKRHKAVGSGVVKADPKGDLVLYVDYARLKEQHDFYKSKWEDKNDSLFSIINLEQENARLKAEVERLKERNQHLEQIDSYLQSANLNAEEQRSIELEAQVERLKADLNKMTKTPDGVDYVEVDVGFWTKSGSRLPSSYHTFWSNAKGVQS